MARSYLFVPGDRPERYEKACASGADVVIVDLEDAVAASEKTSARTSLARWLSAQQPVAVRINGCGTAWFDDDLALCSHPGVQAVMMPKAETPDVVERIAAAAPQARILPLIETARGFANLPALAQAAGVQRLVFGSIDFQADLGIEGDGEELLYFRSQLVLASRLAGLLAPVDGVTTAIDDAARLQTDARRARRLGFGAKLCIHPRQVTAVNEAFRPSADELAWARRVVDAYERAQGGAVAIDGAMVDRPVVLRARAMLEQAGQV